MCISTAYKDSEGGPVIAEYIESVKQENGSVIMTDIMGKETTVLGMLKFADLSRGTLVIQEKE